MKGMYAMKKYFKPYMEITERKYKLTDPICNSVSFPTDQLTDGDDCGEDIFSNEG